MSNNLILIDNYYRVLDDGFVGLKDFMGSDEDIERAARVSYGAGTRKVNETRGLLRYLMRHRHSTPTEMGEMVFHVRLPIYVVRQWHRHRTWSYNEYSGRYSEMIDSCEVVKANEWRTQSQTNKQGSGDYVDDNWPEGFTFKNHCILDENGDYFAEDMGVGPKEFLDSKQNYIIGAARQVYEYRLKLGVAKEQARKDLPVSNYTEMYAKADLKNLLGFLSLRCDSHAQLEIRQYANIMAGFVKELFPLTFEAWYDYHFQSVSFSRMERILFGHVRNGLTTGQVESKAYELNLSKREIDEFWSKMNAPEEQDFDLGKYEKLDMENNDAIT